jgi:glycosyltransferase involved in cell wall biosynthesis
MSGSGLLAPRVEGTDAPLISVVMPVYNVERYVADAIASILAQNYTHFEFIITDDGSTDDSARIIREFAQRDSRIKPLFLSHGGRGYAANAAIHQAQGALIARMDADDIALPERLSIQLAWMNRNRVDICGACARRFNEGDNLWWFPESCEAIRHELLFRCALLQPTVMIRAEVAKSHLYDEGCSFEDYELWTRLALKYRMNNIPQVLLKYRAHPAQSHTMEDLAHQADVMKFRRRYFFEMFPQSTPDDYAALSCLVERTAFSSAAELKLAGIWLVRLADIPDAFLHRKMAERWFAACLRSAHLGSACFKVYRQIRPQLGDASDDKSLRLSLLCALRIKTDSKLYRALSSLKRNLTKRKRRA